VKTLGELANLPESDAVATLGAPSGVNCATRGRTDDRPVAERGEAKQVSAETTFDIDVVDLTRLRTEVRRIAAGATRAWSRPAGSPARW